MAQSDDDALCGVCFTLICDQDAYVTTSGVRLCHICYEELEAPDEA